MDCHYSKLPNNEDFLKSFNDRVFKERIPISGGMDITGRCNLRCIHCYLKPASYADDKDLPTKSVKRLISECADAGCMYFLITGGEPMLRQDFADIYLHTKKAGMLATVFTNGTLIEERTADMFAEYPPQGVEISIYGSSAETHERITGVKGSFARTIAGLELLLSKKVKTSIKTIIMKNNVNEFDGMIEIADNHGIKFRADPELFPAIDGDKSACDLRAPPKLAVELEMRIPGRREDWRKFLDRMQHIQQDGALYECAAGMSFFHISSSGLLRPCLMSTDIGIDMNNMSFLKAWREVMPSVFDRNTKGDFKCAKCPDRLACDSCPSFFMLENGSKLSYSSYICGIARERIDGISGGFNNEK